MENNLNNRMNEKVLPIVAAVVGHSIWSRRSSRPLHMGVQLSFYAYGLVGDLPGRSSDCKVFHRLPDSQYIDTDGKIQAFPQR